MENVPQELIDEARKKGIVPGAFVQCAFMRIDKGIVLNPDKWILDGKQIFFINKQGEQVLLRRANGKQWATVITPAPAEPEGLNAGDAVECGPAMRAAIIELAKELGLKTGWGGHDTQKTIQYISQYGVMTVLDISHPQDGERHTPEAFIAKMRVTAAQPKPEPPIKIDGHEVKFETGHIKVGCQTIFNATVRAIAEKLID